MVRRRALRRTLMAATVAVGVNALSVSAQARLRLWGRLSPNHALVCHTAAISPAWTWFLLEARRLERARERPPEGRSNVVGSALSGVALVLVVAGFRRVGPGALVNSDIFDVAPHRWQTGGPYAIVRDPIYLGYGLSLAGRGLSRRSPELLVVAAWLAAVLVVIEAPVERWAHARVRQVGG